MSQDVATCREDDSLDRAAQLMWDRDVGSVPVVDGEGRPLGMITDRDICMAAYTQGEALSALRVGGAMARGVTVCQAEDAIDRAEQQMREDQIRRLPVVDGGKLVGIVSLNDIALAASDKRRNGVSFDEVGKTMAAICRHRQQPTLASHAA
jgi:CBS domain-containing protein